MTSSFHHHVCHVTFLPSRVLCCVRGGAGVSGGQPEVRLEAKFNCICLNVQVKGHANLKLVWQMFPLTCANQQLAQLASCLQPPVEGEAVGASEGAEPRPSWGMAPVALHRNCLRLSLVLMVLLVRLVLTVHQQHLQLFKDAQRLTDSFSGFIDGKLLLWKTLQW